MIDYHIHTEHSIDAQGSLKEYLERAISIGLKEICITNHCELDPLRDDNLIRFNGEVEPISYSGLERLQNEILSCRELYRKKGLNIKFGIEVGYFDGVEQRLREITRGLNLDYILAGIHCLGHICIDSSKECYTYFEKNSSERLLEQYFLAMESLIRSRLFDVVAHFDVYKKYGLSFYGEGLRKVDKERVYQIFKLMAEYQIGLEINTAGLRRHNEFYPAGEFMELAKDAGIEIITIGSDSHKPDDLGRGIREALDYASNYGFKRIFGFEKRCEFPLDFFQK
jgi:histidinol-phosphatase (PHP family)